MPDNTFIPVRYARDLLRENYFFPFYFRFCTLKLLIVTDSGGSFDNAGFGLGLFLQAMSVNPDPYVIFNITTANRRTDASAALQNFRFDTHDLTQYDQIWLFGVERTGTSITNDELIALTNFMENGGGVFATGDHEDLGVDMCGRVPRVRSMRRWYHPTPGPLGEPVAPNQSAFSGGPFGPHDTVTDTNLAMAGLQGTQSDEVPQTIFPVWYRHISFTPFKDVQSPHPILCSPQGLIMVLPDHMHEGLCEVPTNLTATLSFGNNFSVQEYPMNVPPQVIAEARNNLTNQKFGVIGVYDGHLAGGRGRVVVDATWHHFFNINLMGFEAVSNPSLPTYNATAANKYEQIKTYFRNIAVWLAPPSMQTCIRNRGLVNLRWAYDALITFRDFRVFETAQAARDYEYIIRFGTVARNVLGGLAPECEVVTWIYPLLEEWEIFRGLPWDPPIPLPDPPPLFDINELLTAALGGIAHTLWEYIPDMPAEKFEINDDELHELFSLGVRRGVAAVYEAKVAAADSVRDQLKRLREMELYRKD